MQQIHEYIVKSFSKDKNIPCAWGKYLFFVRGRWNVGRFLISEFPEIEIRYGSSRPDASKKKRLYHPAESSFSRTFFKRAGIIINSWIKLACLPVQH